MDFITFLTVQITYVSSVCFYPPDLMKQDVYLQNHLYHSQPNTPLLECVAICSSEMDCLSFSFQAEDVSCHLHANDSAMNPMELTNRTGWAHSHITVWPKATTDQCRARSCKTGQRCFWSHRIHLPVCVDAWANPEGLVCPPPPQLPNAEVSSGQNDEGSVRSYTCSHGYLDISLDDVTANTTCLKNGSWSIVNLNCTGPYIRVDVPESPKQQYQQLPTEVFQHITGSTTTIIFQGKACNDLNTVFHTFSNTRADHRPSPSFEVVIGGWRNTKSQIRYPVGFFPKNIYAERNIVSCNEFRSFWISWGNSTIRVGKGKVAGRRVFIQIAPKNIMTINYISLTAYTANKGVWLF